VRNFHSPEILCIDVPFLRSHPPADSVVYCTRDHSALHDAMAHAPTLVAGGSGAGLDQNTIDGGRIENGGRLVFQGAAVEQYPGSVVKNHLFQPLAERTGSKSFEIP